MKIADTDVLIDFLNGKAGPEVRELLEQGELLTTVINRFELLSGAKSEKQLARVVNLLDAIPAALPFDNAAADSASRIRLHLEQLGTPIGIMDCLIASIAITNGRELLTRNWRHFQRVPGLQLATDEEN